MCGIVGVFQNSKEVNSEKLLEATKALSHRGPDAQKIWISPNKNIGFGHARLSIIDLEKGDQPLSNINNTIHAVVNGELYDYEKIRDKLREKGYKFKTNSDSEIALYLYEEYGLDFVHHLRGEFSILLWDSNKRNLIAVRDRFGIKPLYYFQNNNDFYFASEVKSLQKYGIPLQWDEESLYHSLFLIAPLQNRSLFNGVKQVPPGHLMTINEKDFNIKQYWDSEHPKESDIGNRKTDEQYIEEFKNVLEESIKIRLRADVPLACYLSGGLDSSSVAGIAQRHLNTPLHTFTLAFEDDDYNEAIFARETSEKINTIQHMIPVTANDLVDNFADAIWHAETLVLNAHVAAKFMLSKVVRKEGFKVVLTGEGADEMLAGYPNFKVDLISHEFKGKSKEESEKALYKLFEGNEVSKGFLLPEKNSKDLKIKELLGYSPSWMQSHASAGEIGRSFLKNNFQNKFQDNDPYFEVLKSIDYKNKLTGRHPVNQSLYLWSKSTLPNYILTVLGDRMEMAHSIEGRVPFLDHHLAEIAQKLPIDLKIRNFNEKFVLREAAKDVLTKTLYERQKHPFLSAPSTSKKNKRLYDFMESTIRSNIIKRIPIFDEKKILEFLDSRKSFDQEKQTSSETLTMKITSACIIAEKFGL